MMTQTTPTLDHAPLLSSRFVWKLTAIVAVLGLITVVIAISGRMIGTSIALAGNTPDQTLYEIVIGNDVLRLPANVIRFQSQRVSGVQGAVDTYFAWPGMTGYSEATRDMFSQQKAGSANGLVFARVTQATMSRDMSGRFAPIYQRLTEGAPVAGPNGLDSIRLRTGAGYANELLYVERTSGAQPYTVRCLVEEAGPDQSFTTRTGCQRDILIGKGLSLTYRFSIDLLPHWRDIESDVRTRFEAALAD